MNFRLRCAKLSDLNDLMELSQLVTFINLPPDQRIIEEKLQNSERSFQSPSKELWRDYYIFVLEDISKNKVIGVSMIHAQHGTENEPHFYLKVDKEQKYSESINTGFIHGTLKLGYDTDGPTEIGGLVLHPDYRGNSLKLGKQLSYVRFLYIGMYPKRFKELIHSELMPPLDMDGNSPLWEAIGRRFLNMDYQAADVLSRKNKEFILSLYPSDTIYETLLPIDARHAIGQVGKETEPVEKMLKSIGFKYTHEVDPFDGGPHYRAKQGNISLIKNMGKAQLRYSKDLEAGSNKYLVNIPNAKYFFESAVLDCQLKQGPNGTELISNDERICEFTSSQTAETFYIKF